MKKIILLFIILFLSGCSDYKELNNLEFEADSYDLKLDLIIEG